MFKKLIEKFIIYYLWKVGGCFTFKPSGEMRYILMISQSEYWHLRDQKIMRSALEDFDGLMAINIRLAERMHSQICKCGHRHDSHGKRTSINYTAGVCSECSCPAFLMKPLGDA